MARKTDVDSWNLNTNSEPRGKCKMCHEFYYFYEMVSYNKFNCVCRNCIRNMTDIFELSESDLEDIITNAGRDLAKGIEQ